VDEEAVGGGLEDAAVVLLAVGLCAHVAHHAQEGGPPLVGEAAAGHLDVEDRPVAAHVLGAAAELAAGPGDPHELVEQAVAVGVDELGGVHAGHVVVAVHATEGGVGGQEPPGLEIVDGQAVAGGLEDAAVLLFLAGEALQGLSGGCDVAAEAEHRSPGQGGDGGGEPEGAFGEPRSLLQGLGRPRLQGVTDGLP